MRGAFVWNLSRLFRPATTTCQAILGFVVLLAPTIACAQSQAEIDRLAEVLQLHEGAAVAEIGAGSGTFTVGIARRIGPAGQMYSTELDKSRLRDIRQAVSTAGLANVTVVEAGAEETRLPAACCDVVFMRDVYHHFTKPDVMVASLLATVRPGGLLAIIDFPPRGANRTGASRERGEHGITPAALQREVTSGGFELVRQEDDWPGNDNYLLLFRRPPAS